MRNVRWRIGLDFLYAELTQLEACLPYKEEVVGSSPSFRTIGVNLWNLLGLSKSSMTTLRRIGLRLSTLNYISYARLTEAAFGRVLKTLGTVMSRMGIDTSVWRHLKMLTFF